MQMQNSLRTSGSRCSNDTCVKSCEQDWEKNGEHCYLWSTDNKTWTDAEDFCLEKVGGSMTEGEAKGLIHQADKDGNESIDFSEFSKLWAAIKGEGEGEKEIRKEFSKLDVDNSGFITKDEMLTVITDCDHFAGDKMEEAKKCIAELDVDKDGRVSYPEFLLVWKYKSK